MPTERLSIIHPGEILKLDFLEPMSLTPYRLALDITIPEARLCEILNGKRDIDPDIADRLSRYFGNSAQFWLNLQALYNTRIAKV